MIIRAIGPELTPFGINDALANPRLELHNGNWSTDWQLTMTGRQQYSAALLP